MVVPAAPHGTRRCRGPTGNTAAICRKCYVHPAVVEAYTGGKLHRAFSACRSEAPRKPQNGLRVEEAAVLALLTRLGRERSLTTDIARSVRVLKA